MTRRILATRPIPITDKSRSRTLGAMWMQELTETMTRAERQALAGALALLLERSRLAACGQEGLAR